MQPGRPWYRPLLFLFLQAFLIVFIIIIFIIILNSWNSFLPYSLHCVITLYMVCGLNFLDPKDSCGVVYSHSIVDVAICLQSGDPHNTGQPITSMIYPVRDLKSRISSKFFGPTECKFSINVYVHRERFIELGGM